MIASSEGSHYDPRIMINQMFRQQTAAFLMRDLTYSVWWFYCVSVAADMFSDMDE